MLLEYAQMLSTVVRLNGFSVGYKTTHINHPCTVWVGKSLSNWRWLHTLTCALHEEYRYRFGVHKVHKSYALVLTLPEPRIKDVGLTLPALAMPEAYKVSCPVTSYRNYYVGEKQHIAKWSGREVPGWFKLKFSNS